MKPNAFPVSGLALLLAVSSLSAAAFAAVKASEKSSLPSADSESAEYSRFNSSMMWEVIETNEEPHLGWLIRRTRVPGGWLVESMFDRIYRSTAQRDKTGLSAGVGLTFVPDPDGLWQPRVIRTFGPSP